MDRALTGKILVVDDDRQLQDTLCTFLESNGFKTVSLLSGQGVVAAIRENRPDVVLLDVMLPDGVDGFEALRRIRSRFAIPVLMITARGREIDTVVGLESGADDYLAKPFRMLELLARIRAVLRRIRADPSAAPPAARKPDLVRTGEFALNLRAHTLHWKEKSVELSGTEVKLLQPLMENPGDVLQRDVLLNLAFGREYHTTNRNVDVHVSHIRARLKELAPDLAPIRTVWGSGYRWMEHG